MVRPALFSRVLLLACVLLGAGCTGPLSIENRGCPCSSGYECCQGMCVLPGTMCKQVDAHFERAQVRQGDIITLIVTGKDLTEVRNLRVGEISLATTGTSGHQLRVPVPIPNGTSLGKKNLSFTTKGGSTHLFTDALIVSPITVSAAGHDSNLGTEDSPLRTLQQAFIYAGPGDTVMLADDLSRVGPDADDTVVEIPEQVTLVGQLRVNGEGPGSEIRPRTVVGGRLYVKRQARLRNVMLVHRVTLNTSGSSLTLDNVQAADGREAGVLVEYTARGSTVSIVGYLSRLTSNAAPPVEILAPDVILSIVGPTQVVSTSTEREAVRLQSENAHVEIDGATISAPGSNALVAIHRGQFNVSNAEFHGILQLMAPGSIAQVKSCKFFISSDSTGNGGLYFSGEHLTVTDSKFFLVGLRQEVDEGEVVVRNTLFLNYQKTPITVFSGRLNLGTLEEPGENRFEASNSNGLGQPVAIEVAAPTGRAAVSVSHTSVGGVIPQPRSKMGPHTLVPFYKIDYMVPIVLY